MWKYIWTFMLPQWWWKDSFLPFMRGRKSRKSVVHIFILILIRLGYRRPCVFIILRFKGWFFLRLISYQPWAGKRLAIKPDFFAVRSGSFFQCPVPWSGHIMEHNKEQKGNSLMSIWIFVLVIVVWFALQAYILPKFGISTWLRNSCQVGDIVNKEVKPTEKPFKWFAAFWEGFFGRRLKKTALFRFMILKNSFSELVRPQGTWWICEYPRSLFKTVNRSMI